MVRLGSEGVGSSCLQDVSVMPNVNKIMKQSICNIIFMKIDLIFETANLVVLRCLCNSFIAVEYAIDD